MKITLLIPTLDRSGAEKQLTLLACGLPKTEFDVDVVCLTRGGPYEAALKEHDVPVTILRKRSKFDVSALLKLRRHLKERDPDILHTWIFAANSYGRLVAGKHSKPKVLVSERCVDSWKSNWQHWLDRRQISRTTRLIGNSNSVVDFYRGRGVPSEKLVAIPNGIEIPSTGLRKEERTARLAEFNIPPEGKVIGFAGRLAKQKRVDDLIWATELLRQLDEQAYFLLIGDGPEADELVHFAQTTGAIKNIRFAGHRDDCEQLFPLMDAFWLASDFEGQSNSIMEAMSWGLPVIATDIAPNAELVADGETGILAPVGGRVEFAQAAHKLLSDVELRTRLGKAGQDRMKTAFSVEQMVDAYANLYRAC